MNQTPLELHVKGLMEEQIKKDNQHPRAFGIHASSISGPCMRKVWYEINGVPFEYDLKTKGRFKLGSAVHEIIILSKANEIELAGDIRNEKKISPKAIKESNKFDCIVGRSDDFIMHDGTVVVVDKKTFSSKWEIGIPKKASDDYVFQINVYKYLYWLKTGIELQKGVIAYVDVATGLSDIRVFEVDLRTLEEIRSIILNKLDKLNSENPPEMIPTWRCKGCPFNQKGICEVSELPNYQELIKNG